MTPGDWRYTVSTGGSTASFGGGLLTLQCRLPAHTVALTRAAPASNQIIAVTVTTSDMARTLTGRGTAAGVELVLPARDPLLDAMAFSRGRFALAIPGQPSLHVPSWTEVSRVVEDCR